MRGILTVIFVAVAHSFAGLVCGIGELVTGGFFERIPAPSHPAFDSMRQVLEFPLLTIAHMYDVTMNIFILPIMIANSFIWGAAVYLCVAFIGRSVLVSTGQKR